MSRTEQVKKRLNKQRSLSQPGDAQASEGEKGGSRIIDMLVKNLERGEARARGEDLERGDKKGSVVPIISNSIRTNWILDVDFDERLGLEDEFQGKVPDLANLEQELAQSWAGSFKYPYGIPALPESLYELLEEHSGILDQGRSGDDLVDHLIQVVNDLLDLEEHLRQVAQYNHLARAAQYRQLIPEDPQRIPEGRKLVLPELGRKRLANEDYLSFLKQYLLERARQDPNPTLPALLRDELKVLIEAGEYSFSDLAQDLGYPRFSEQYPDVLRMLAQLPVRIYITTSYYDFLERLLQAEGKQPQTQICSFRNGTRGSSELKATINNPVVYHLYGIERNPASLVMSESDYVDFLIAMAKDTDPERRIVPWYIREALADSTLLLLGYRVQDWDLRVLFRSLLKLQETTSEFSQFNVALQLSPKDQEYIQHPERAEHYLREYFESVHFDVALSSTVDFVQTLYNEWKKRKSGNGRYQ